ncbi:Intraflagellar transport protein 52 like, partial [Dissostichus eleginoides]
DTSKVIYFHKVEIFHSSHAKDVKFDHSTRQRLPVRTTLGLQEGDENPRVFTSLFDVTAQVIHTLPLVIG